MKMLGSEDIFATRTWEDLQIAIAQLLGISIRVTDDTGRVRANYDSFSELCSALKKGAKLCPMCNAFDGKPVEPTEEPVVCPGRICHYTATSEFFYKTFYITVSALCNEHDDEFIEQAAKEAGMHPSDLGFLYATHPNYPEDKLKSWARLIANMFTKVMEPALQTNIMYMAEKEKEEEINKMRMLMHSNITINSTKVLSQLINIICETAESLVDAEACVIYRVDYEKNELYTEWTNSQRDLFLTNKRIKFGDGITGMVAKTGMAELVQDTAKDPRFTAEEELKDFKTRSMICIPMRTGGRMTGILKVCNKKDGRSFISSDQLFLGPLAAQAAIAIENAGIYENMEDAAFVLNHQLSKANVNLDIEKRRIESIVRSMEDAVLAVDNNRHIVLINRGAEKLFNIPPGKGMYAPVDHFIKDQKLLDSLSASVKDAVNINDEFLFPLFDEDHVYAAVFAPIKDESGRSAGGVAVFRDITEIKRLDNMKTEFLNMVAHELRTPLTPIVAYIQLMLVKQLTPEKIKKYATLIFRETQRLSVLINDLLDLSRIESGKGLTLNIEPMDLRDLADGVYETFHDASPKHTLVVDAPAPVMVEADKDRLTQVLINLMSNAVKYSPEGGEVRIIVRENGDTASVAVKDSGIGIPRSEIPNLFSKFFRVSNKKVNKIQGTGIGLTIVKKIMECHYGTVGVESEDGHGSTFTFSLPKTYKGVVV